MPGNPEGAPAGQARPVLSLRHAAKSFGAVHAVVDSSADLYPGEAHALLGENGAGKSTVVKMLAGVYPPDSGELLIDGAPVTLHSPAAPNQNAWIGYMKQQLKKYPKMHLVSIVYGNDDPTTATQVTQGLLQQHPNLKGIISPTTVGVLAAAQVVDSPKYKGKVAVTGLGTPNSLKKYVADGTVKAFELWNPADLGYLAAFAAVNFASKKISNAAGQSFTAGKLGKYTVGADRSILLGPPFVFTKANINNFNF